MHLDGDPGRRLALGPVSPGECLSARCPVPGELKLRLFLEPWSPALSCVSSSTRTGHPGIDWHSEFFHLAEPLALTSIGRHEVPYGHMSTFCPLGGETEGNIFWPMGLDEWSSVRCAALGALKLRPFLAPWSPALSCVSSSAQVDSFPERRRRVASLEIDPKKDTFRQAGRGNGGPGRKRFLQPNAVQLLAETWCTGQAWRTTQAT
ncbi:hypothetical protein AAY473_011469 [Plecturocebus cupreus]